MQNSSLLPLFLRQQMLKLSTCRHSCQVMAWQLARTHHAMHQAPTMTTLTAPHCAQCLLLAAHIHGTCHQCNASSTTSCTAPPPHTPSGSRATLPLPLASSTGPHHEAAHGLTRHDLRHMGDCALAVHRLLSTDTHENNTERRSPDKPSCKRTVCASAAACMCVYVCAACCPCLPHAGPVPQLL